MQYQPHLCVTDASVDQKKIPEAEKQNRISDEQIILSARDRRAYNKVLSFNVQRANMKLEFGLIKHIDKFVFIVAYNQEYPASKLGEVSIIEDEYVIEKMIYYLFNIYSDMEPSGDTVSEKYLDENRKLQYGENVFYNCPLFIYKCH